MRHFFAAILLGLTLIFTTNPANAQSNSESIILTLPESVLAKAITALLPMKVDAHSKAIDGDITIINISGLQIEKNKLSAKLHLAGKNLAFLTQIAGHEIRLKVGEIEIMFATDAALRFDAQRQTLYIKPLIKDMSASGSGSNAEIGQALLAILNGRELPISLQNLGPVMANTGTKTVAIESRVTAIKAKKDMLQFSLAPEIKTINLQK